MINQKVFKSLNTKLIRASSNFKKQINSRNETKNILLESIKNHSYLYIGGYSNIHVPNILLKNLVDIKCSNLTVITNVSIEKNLHLKNLFQMKGRVKRIITSLDENKINFKYQSQIQLELLDSREFLTGFCYSGLFQSKEIDHEISLVRSPYCDLFGNLLWPLDQSSYYNEQFAKISSHTIAECLNVIEDETGYTRVASFYVNNIILNNELDLMQNISLKDSQKQDLYLINDPKIQTIIHRILQEFYNECTVYIADSLAYLIEKFYMPKHLNINLTNSHVNQNYPCNIEWVNGASKIDLCIIECSEVNIFGEIKKSSCLSQQQIDMANNSNCKLIVVIRELKHEAMKNLMNMRIHC